MRKHKIYPFSLLILFLALACNQPLPKEQKAEPVGNHIEKFSGEGIKGKLFIIGGGKRPDSLMLRIVHESGVDKGGYAVVLPMSSSIPDTVAMTAVEQFNGIGLKNIFGLNFEKDENAPQSKIDSVKNAKLIYITGGNQNKFMDIVLNTPIYDAIHTAYKNGATIAGTSAGAAVMSKKMITGNEIKYPEYTGKYRTIEANNIEIKEGLGLLPNAIVDQHFIKRMRMNRLISTAIENPEKISIGIDESTAILVEKGWATVCGVSQVIVLKNMKNSKKEDRGLLGSEGMELSVYLLGNKFKL